MKQQQNNLSITAKILTLQSFIPHKDCVQRPSSKNYYGVSLVVQWQRIHLPMQETWVPSLVQEDPTCPGVTNPASCSQ